MTEIDQDVERDKAPTAEEIEHRFRSPLIVATRPLLLGTMSASSVVRSFHWQGQFECDLNRMDGSVVFAANHRSHADTAAILGTLPKTMRHRTAVAAALDVFGSDNQNGLRRKVSKDILQLLVGAGFHAFAFDRLGPPLRSVRTSVQLIRNGWNLLLYPEGTRSRNGQMAPFKAGVGLLARFTQRPVVPVFVDGGDTILPYGLFMPRAGQAIVHYGSPLWYQDGDTPTSFTNRVEQAVGELARRHAEAMRPAAGSHPALNGRARKQPA